jgi:HAD superfamily hydrolase (TIGR01509 family)
MTRTSGLGAVIFDLDGTIVDSETPEWTAWQEVYRQHGVELTLAVWSQVLGREREAFDAVAHLEDLVGRPLPRAEITAEVHRRFRELLAAEPVRPGVPALLNALAAEGVRLGIATSGRRAWAVAALDRAGVRGFFHAIATVDDVARAKPDPALYRLCLERLGVEAASAVAVEDSPNGATAAARAGLAVLVVKNPVTASLPFPPVDAEFPSLEGVTPRELAALLARRAHGGSAGREA